MNGGSHISSLLKQSRFCRQLWNAFRSGLPQAVRHMCSALQAEHRIRCYLKTTAEPRLHLGAGTNILHGWLNTDLEPQRSEIVMLNVTQRLPLPDAGFRAVYAEHLIEHLSYEQALQLLRECWRVLQPGSRLRIVTPDLGKLVGLFTTATNGEAIAATHEYVRLLLPGTESHQRTFVLNNEFRSWGHQFLYDRSTLEDLLLSAGFVSPAWRDIGESDCVHLSNLERHGQAIGSDLVNRYFSMAVEVERPRPVPASYSKS